MYCTLPHLDRSETEQYIGSHMAYSGCSQEVFTEKVNNPASVSLLSGDRKPQIRFLGNHHSGDGNLYHKSFRM